MSAPLPPSLTLDRSGTQERVVARGAWNVHELSATRERAAALSAQFESFALQRDVVWDLRGVSALDHVGAIYFFRAWKRSVPAGAQIDPEHLEFFKNLARSDSPKHAAHEGHWLDPVRALGTGTFGFANHLNGFTALLGQIVLDTLRLVKNPRAGPWREISANLYRSGAQALGITALVGFLIGIVLSYLSAKQLKTFGADIFIVDLLAIAVIRELGPVLAAILVAGRSGSAMTAALGVMRVTEELDALQVMGIPHGFRLIMPKVIALAIALPLLTLWTNAVALLGGMVAAWLQLDLSISFFFNAIPSAVKVANLYIGLLKGAVFGMLIALISCHFGLRIEPNTESLGQGTTSSVVTSITAVILADAVFAIAFSNVGI